jgi:hypothetical protein
MRDAVRKTVESRGARVESRKTRGRTLIAADLHGLVREMSEDERESVFRPADIIAFAGMDDGIPHRSD